MNGWSLVPQIPARPKSHMQLFAPSVIKKKKMIRESGFTDPHDIL